MRATVAFVLAQSADLLTWCAFAVWARELNPFVASLGIGNAIAAKLGLIAAGPLIGWGVGRTRYRLVGVVMLTLGIAAGVLGALSNLPRHV